MRYLQFLFVLLIAIVFTGGTPIQAQNLSVTVSTGIDQNLWRAPGYNQMILRQRRTMTPSVAAHISRRVNAWHQSIAIGYRSVRLDYDYEIPVIERGSVHSFTYDAIYFGPTIGIYPLKNLNVYIGGSIQLNMLFNKAGAVHTQEFDYDLSDTGVITETKDLSHIVNGLSISPQMVIGGDFQLTETLSLGARLDYTYLWRSTRREEHQSIPLAGASLTLRKVLSYQ